MCEELIPQKCPVPNCNGSLVLSNMESTWTTSIYRCPSCRVSIAHKTLFGRIAEVSSVGVSTALAISLLGKISEQVVSMGKEVADAIVDNLDSV